MRRKGTQLHWNRIRVLLVLVVLCLVGCGAPKQPAQENTETGFVPAKVGNYDSADTAVLLRKNLEEQTLTFYNCQVDRSYTLNFDGATSYADKYGMPMSLEQIKEGELVDITFMKERRRLNTMSLAAEAFRITPITNFATVGRNVYLGQEEFTLDSEVLVITPEGPKELMDIAAVDTLTLVGIDHTIYSIIVEQGHGYLRLENEGYFVGGWLEISQSCIYPVEADMLYTVPTGTYDVTISGGGCTGTETLQIETGKEILWDVARWQGEEKLGTLVFSVTPENARVYLDGNALDISQPQELTYGTHQMIVVADGYETISKYIRVNMEYSSMDILMEPKTGQSASENTVSGNTLSGNSVSANATVSGNSLSGNAISANTIPGNTNSAAAGAGNTNSAASGAGNTNAAVPGSDSAGSAATSAGNSLSGNSVIENLVAGEYRVYIDEPKDTEVFLDGSYIGIAPISFPKAAGNHEITLRRTGHQTRTYTIVVDGNPKDVHFSFSALEEI